MATRKAGPKTLATMCARICLDKKAEDVVLLDLRKETFIADYFVICSTDSDRQAKAIADAIEEHMTTAGLRRVGGPSILGPWTLLDFGRVVCHLFLRESRSFYDLESLWQNAPRVAFKPPKRR